MPEITDREDAIKMSFMDKIKDFVGIEDEYEDELEISQEEIDNYKKQMSGGASTPSMGQSFSAAPAGRIEEPLKTGISSPLSFSDLMTPPPAADKNIADAKASINQSEPFKMVVIEPKNIDECRKLIENLRQRKPVIINLEKVETELAHKMFNFLSGATCALCGTVQKINPNIYLFAPNNVNIKAMVDRATEAGKPANSNPWK